MSAFAAGRARITRRLAHLAEISLRWLTASVFRSTAIFIVLTFLPVLLLTYYIVASSIRTSKAEEARTDSEVLGVAGLVVRTNLHAELDALSALGDSPTWRRILGPEEISPFRIASPHGEQVTLDRFLRRHKELAAVGIYDVNGRLRAAASSGWGVFPNQWEPDQWESAWEPHNALISPSSCPGMVGTFCLYAPVEVEDDQVGLLAAALPRTLLGSLLRRSNPVGQRSVYILDSAGHVWANPNGGVTMSAAELASLPGVSAALHGQSGAVQFLSPSRLESLVVSYAPLPELHAALVVVRPVRIGFYVARVFYDKLALIATIVFLLAVVSGALLRAAFQSYLRYSRAVESARNQTEALLGSIGDGVFAVDANGHIIEFNRAAELLTGRARSEVQGQPYEGVMRWVVTGPGGGAAFGEERTAPDPVRQAILEHRSQRLRYLSLARLNGTRVPVTLNAAPVLDNQGQVRGCVVVFSDASQEREVDRLKTEFISIASHQLRTPLTGIKGVLSLVLEGVLGPLNAEQRRYIERANEANERLITLVNDLLNVGKLEQGQLQIAPQPLDLTALVEAVVSELQPRAQRYHQSLSFAAAERPLEVAGDPLRLREVFANLVDNAVKYTPEGGRISVRVGRSDGQVAVEVADTGVGIPSDQIPRLFQKFVRLPNPLSAREFGTGLGLYFIKSVVELHRGSIEVQSQEGQGSVFRVRLPPREAAAPVAVTSAAQDISTPPAPLGDPRRSA